MIEFEPGLDSFIDQLLLRETDAKVIFQDASLLNMTGKDYAWIVTEQALEARNVPTSVFYGAYSHQDLLRWCPFCSHSAIHSGFW